MADFGREAAHFGRFEYDARWRCMWKLGSLEGFAEEREEEVDDIEVSEPVDAKVTVDTVGVEAEGVCVYSGGADQLER